MAGVNARHKSGLNQRMAAEDYPAFAASSMKAATSTGIEASEAWLAFSVMTFFAPSRPDIQRWLSGWIIRSSLEI